MPVIGPKNSITRSATSFIKSGLRLVGALRSGLNLSNDELTDCQQVLNDMLDAFSAERVIIPAISIITLDDNQAPLSLVANQGSYKLGNVNQNEDFLMPRPVRVERVSITYAASLSNAVELPMEMLDSVQWQGVANKPSSSLLPQQCFADESNAVFPDTVLYFWPVPTQANPVILYIWQALSQFADLNTQFQFPPAYAELLRFQLAVRLAAEFPCDLKKFEIVSRLAQQAWDRVVGVNVRPLEAVCDEALLGSNGSMGNIITGAANRSLRH
jgi:hypothetical protein